MRHVLHVPSALTRSLCGHTSVSFRLCWGLWSSCVMSPTVYMPLSVFPAPRKKHNFCPRSCTPPILLDNLQLTFQNDCVSLCGHISSKWEFPTTQHLTTGLFGWSVLQSLWKCWSYFLEPSFFLGHKDCSSEKPSGTPLVYIIFHPWFPCSPQLPHHSRPHSA